MKLNRLLQLIFGFVLLFSISCTSDYYEETITELTYENGYFITNEGGFNKQNAEVSFLTKDMNLLQNDIFKANNNESLGDVLQTMAFSGNSAYLVINNSNKIEIVDRVTFKKKATVTSNIDNPRYIAFSGNKYFVTNNNFFDVMKLNVYNTADNSFVSSIDFPRTAEKVVEAGGKIVVQTDGVTYETVAPYGELATGYSVTIVDPASNAVSSTITLPSNGIIRDLISYNGDAYVLASGNAASYIYKINTASGTFTTTTLSGLAQAQKLKIDSNRFYFNDNSNKIYSMPLSSTTVPTVPLLTTTGTLYGFNVIDGRIFTSDASFTGSSTVNVYSANGLLIKTMSTGVGTNGFYSN